MMTSVFSFLKSFDFFKSVTLLLAILVPLGVLAGVGHPELSVSVAMGVFLCSPSDVPGSTRHMAMGILVSSLLATFTTLAIHLAYGSAWQLVPVLGAVVFVNSMLAVYGFRASLVSFSGLLAIIFAFAHPTAGGDLLVHAALILGGGIWYLGVALLAHKLVSRRHNQRLLAECTKLTAEYLNVRGRLLQGREPGQELQKELFRLQTEINEKHEKLREIFVAGRTRAGTSHFTNRYILIFIELVDILELSMSNPANYQRIRSFFHEKEEFLKPFVTIVLSMSRNLNLLADAIAGEKKLDDYPSISPLFEEAEEKAMHYLKANGNSLTDEGGIILRNLLDYEQKQQQRIESIERVLRDLVDQESIRVRSRDVEKFITPQDYDLKVLRQNLNANSTIFRHAVRLTATVLIGYTLGSLLPVQNPYWIMLTIVVIMRPNYGLTKSRSIQRVYGTLIGAGIALGVVLLTQNPYVYGTLAALSMVLGFSLVQRNYAGAAVFITLNVIFLFALIRPDALEVIQFRVLDTGIGAGLAFLASLFLWPSWESLNIQSVIADSIQANRHYLQEVSVFYEQKGDVPTSYKLARKEAFLAIGNLNAAFQRMSQEPKSKRGGFAKIYEMVVLNHTFLTAAAAMGTYVQNHSTSAKSEHVQTFIDSTDHHLEEAEARLRHLPLPTDHPAINLDQAASYLDRQFEELSAESGEITLEPVIVRDEQKVLPLMEISLISGQLKWLQSLSEKIRNTAKELF